MMLKSIVMVVGAIGAVMVAAPMAPERDGARMTPNAALLNEGESPILGDSTKNHLAPAQVLTSLQGTWVMDSAYEIHPDGSRTTNYGEHPKGLFIVDAAGRYTIQIFKQDRSAFASGDKAHGTPEEYRAAVVGSSTHIGRVTIHAAEHQLRFAVDAASFPNWEGKTQVRDYTFKDGLLRYAVPANASGNGIVAYSLWRRAPD